jgi:hypothetical protein
MDISVWNKNTCTHIFFSSIFNETHTSGWRFLSSLKGKQDTGLTILYGVLAHLSICSGWAIRITLRPSSIVRCPFTLFKRHLLWNHRADHNETSQGCSLCEALTKLFKEFHSMQNSGYHGNQKKKTLNIFF